MPTHPFGAREQASTSESTRRAWARYVSTGMITDSLLREPVLRAWERAHELGVNPKAMKAEQLSALDTERLLAQQQALITVARPYMDVLSWAVGLESHSIQLADAHAVMLVILGDEESLHGPERQPTPGALLSEEICGTNGTGTTLVTGGYTEVVGPEHFIGGFQIYTCQGIPIRDAEGKVAGNLCAAVRRPMPSSRLRDMLLCAAHGIEAELLLLQLERDIREVMAAPGDEQALRVLREDVERLKKSSREGLRIGARQAGVNRLEYALRLLRLAEDTAQDIRHRAHVWRSLASLEEGQRRPVVLTELVRALLGLLREEALRQRVELVLGEQEPVHVEADVLVLSRQLFHVALQALALAGPGGAVRIDVRLESHVLEGKATFLSLPAPAYAQVAPLPRSVTSPALRLGEEREPLLWRLPTLETAPGEARPASGLV
ncbi:phytochrome sensor protein [Vitiosangium sp. GDMCC 1.1324]|uniref:phytochrome sensor protein n=1 Tax=Vitiosangium sp. (strain GDMCC 1.1324) TaxID=2138576 RepID=UPI000D338E04|nr:phytochrome sensor protein [Vitiosangium sp. GDMCC 1.1324]PTL81679.1 phytochrome sensor protein [Vitiosangium sp. GDMCC 1.1324]